MWLLDQLLHPPAQQLSGPDGLAIAAFVIALVGLLWNIALTFVRWPRLAADLSQTIEVGADNTIRYSVVAVNLGAEEVTVSNAGLGLKKAGAGSFLASVENERANGRSVDGPELPARLPGRAHMKWTFGPEVADGMSSGTEVVAVVQRYRAIRWFHRATALPWYEVRSVRSRTRG